MLALVDLSKIPQPASSYAATLGMEISESLGCLYLKLAESSNMEHSMRNDTNSVNVMYH